MLVKFSIDEHENPLNSSDDVSYREIRQFSNLNRCSAGCNKPETE
jgi:hypothetical protein